MAVGDNPTSASRLRDVCHDISELQMQAAGIGSAGLQAAGFTSAYVVGQ
jgi:hypothetical protein